MLTVMWFVSSNFIPSEVSNWQRTWVTRVPVHLPALSVVIWKAKTEFAPTPSTFALA